MTPTITLDAGLLREEKAAPALRTLKNWEAKGMIDLHEADRAKEPPSNSNATYTWPGATPPPRRNARSRSVHKAAPGSISFQSLSAVLFPMRDSHRLSIGEVNNVAHLLRHYSSGRNYFITNNVETFISAGKREYLASLKIIVLTPDEAVETLGATLKDA